MGRTDLPGRGMRASGFLVLAAGLWIGAMTGGARAQTFDVKQIEVTKGYLGIGLSNTFHAGLPAGVDANRSAHDQALDYGLASWWKVSGVMKLERPLEADFRAARLAFESTFVLRGLDEKKAVDLGLGWFSAVEASIHDDTTNAFVFGPILTLKLDQTTVTANPFLERTFGRNRVDGIAFNYAWHVKHELRKGLAIGVEGFGVVENIGDPPPWREQEHRIGPAIFTEIALTQDVTINPDIGLLFGLTEATPDVAIKLNIGIPLRAGAAAD